MPHPREELSPEGEGSDRRPDALADDAEDPVVIAGTGSDEELGPTSDEELDPRRAYEILEIRTPLEEFDAYGRARIETLAKLGEADRADVTAQALELGRRAIARVTGVPLGGQPGRDGRST